VLYINTAECENAEEFITKVKNATMTAPMRDKRRVLIIDEIQRAFDRNGAKIGQSLLPILEAKRKSKINFIFTMMPISEINDVSQKTRMKAFESRCQVFNYPIFEEMDIVKYMYLLLKKLNLTSTLPIEFKTKGLLAIAKCSENSLRKATMMLQQCVETETYSDSEL
jgi:DNA polymerase III delta prime subunit